MSSREEETYSTMFMSLRHPVRRKILRMLSEKPRSFSKMLEELGITSSHLTYHVEHLGELVSKMEDGRYKLSTFGEAAVATMSRVEEAPKTVEPKHPTVLPLKWKSLLAGLMISLVIFTGVCYAQYQSLNQASVDYGRLKAEYEQISTQHEQLKGLVTLTHFEDVSLQSKHTLRFSFRKEANAMRFTTQGPWDCVIYSPYDNSTLYLVLLIDTLLEDSHVPVSVQEGSSCDPTTNGTATVIWSLNATKSSIHYVSLPTRGWYTISLVGPVRMFFDDSGEVVTYRLGQMPTTLIDIDCSMSLRIIHKGNYIPFIVTHVYKHITWTEYMPSS